MKTSKSFVILYLLLIIPFQSWAQDSSAVFTFTAFAEIDTLLAHGKNESACQALTDILEEAINQNNENEWASSLVQLVQIRAGMKQVIAAVHLLQDSPWPDGLHSRVPLNLYYGYFLNKYLNQNMYQISQKEIIKEASKNNFENWTASELDQEINRAFAEVWSLKDTWSDEGFGELDLWFKPGTYPDRVRNSARDAVAYLWVKHLRNTQYWSPHHHQELKQMEASEFFTDSDKYEIDLSSSDVHPMKKIQHLLRTLRKDHLAAHQGEAALEAELQFMAILIDGLEDKNGEDFIRLKMTDLIRATNPELPWWSKAMWNLGMLQKEELVPDNFIKAWQYFLKGAKQHPESLGGIMCLAELERLQKPDYSLHTMTLDGPDRRSIQIKHRNVSRIYFKAWRIDPSALPKIVQQKSQRNYTNFSETDSLINKTQADMTWFQDVPDGLDYHYHNSYASLPQGKPGAYLVAASLWDDFREKQNILGTFNILNSEFVVSVQEKRNGLHLEVCLGTNGTPVSDVDLKVWIIQKFSDPPVLHCLKTDKRGSAFLSISGDCDYRILAKRGDNVGLYEPNSFYSEGEPKQKVHSFIYNDRPIYRPGQRIQWKVVSFQSEIPQEKFLTRPNMPITISLYDPNNRLVGTKKATTNSFGSASGIFRIPPKALLGNWALKTNNRGYQTIRVEEYKRPTFEVTLKAPKEEIHLEETIQFHGDAKYYFGQPVSDGKFKWSVKRKEIRPLYGRWRREANFEPDIAKGIGKVASDGSFVVEFRALGAPNIKETGIQSYEYHLDVEVINEGGESVNSNRTYSVGESAITAVISPLRNLIILGESAEFEIMRTDLNNSPRQGTGTYSIQRLQPPAKAIRPADRPTQPKGHPYSAYATQGDKQRPRWVEEEHYQLEMTSWPESHEHLRSQVEHDQSGKARISVQGLPQGSYRLVYETSDKSGIPTLVNHEFIVVSNSYNHLPFCLELIAEKDEAMVGETIRFLVSSGLPDQKIFLSIFSNHEFLEERIISAGKDPEIFEIPITNEMRGGLTIEAHAVSDYQDFSREIMLPVLWDNQMLQVEIVEMNNELRCGDMESIRVQITSVDGSPVHYQATELLAFMHDRSLNSFASLKLPSPIDLFHGPQYPGFRHNNLSSAKYNDRIGWWPQNHHDYIELVPPSLANWEYGIYTRSGLSRSKKRTKKIYDSKSDSMIPILEAFNVEGAEYMVEVKSASSNITTGYFSLSTDSKPDPVRSDLAETAFFEPHIQVDSSGQAVIQYRVPQTLTDWNLEFHAMTTDLRFGNLRKTASSSKELVVRPYLPRFLREGDHAEVKVVLNNSTDEDMNCLVEFIILGDPSNRDITHLFGLQDKQRHKVPVTVPADGEANLMFPLSVPSVVGPTALKVVAQCVGYSDAEIRPLPILPSRLHLQQSQFVTVDGVNKRTIEFDQMNDPADTTLQNEKLVVTIDAQLFRSTLAALPYLVNFPHECSEQTLNRYLSTSILNKLYEDIPEVQVMAQKLPTRGSGFMRWEINDPNQKIMPEETPWLNQSRGGSKSPVRLINLLSPKTADNQRLQSLNKLEELQDQSGGFPWFAGGKPSPYNTLYVLQGFARGHEFGLEIPEYMSQLGWMYLGNYFNKDLLDEMKTKDTGWNYSTYLISLMSSYPKQHWLHAFNEDERDFLLEFSFRHWLKLSRMMKVHLSLALHRSNRVEDAQMVLDSVLDMAHDDPDLGLSWPAEERSWLWTRDTIESHSITLRAMTEIYPGDERAAGLAKWLLLNRHLNQWKSTRATAEAIYALAHFMQKNGVLNQPQAVKVNTCKRDSIFEFTPTEFTGMSNHLVIPGHNLNEDNCKTVVVQSQTPGIVFASATWHFSTETIPQTAEGDLLHVERKFFLRTHQDSQMVLIPLANGDQVALGDVIEVHLTLKSKFPMEYIHLRAPRPAGFEPLENTSGRKWQSDLRYYQEIRDSGLNLFIAQMPNGQFKLKHQLQATVAGIFQTGPVTLQSMYAPEFTAYSSGARISVQP